MANNTTHRSGSVFHGKLSDLEYYDKLPPSARKAMANALFDWSAGAIFNKWKRAVPGYKTGTSCAQRVAEWDKHQLARERKRT